MRVEVEGFRLDWEATTDGAELSVLPEAAPASALRLRFVMKPRQHRLAMTMLFPPTNRAIDVSPQPGLLRLALASARSNAAAAGERHELIGMWVSDLAERADAWYPSATPNVGLDATVGGAAFPILGAAYERQSAPLADVPMWAAPILRQATARAAARTAFGSKATRPVTAVFAACFVHPLPGGPLVPAQATVNLTALALGLAGSEVLEPDQLARVLENTRPASVPSGEQIAACRHALARLGPRRAEQLLSDAGRLDGGTTTLAQMANMYAEVGHLLPRPAGSLTALHAQCRALMPVDPNPVRGIAYAAQQGYEALDPPPAPRLRTNSVLHFPPDIQAVHHLDLGALRIVLPRTTMELVAWGHLLGNCLASYAPAAVAGRSLLIGVEAEGRLVYCLELTPGRRARQFLAARNRQVPRRHAEQVLARLAALRVIPDAGNGVGA